ncbi:hypothetical protein RMSM_04635 [Rhodopirellula maiorica SM1]|uniref:Uncharacterized protein n=1 Tax=Rhodopirellula maiorica SM1 TaxID=1265738 RepID=M5RGD1_9BACT|nr:hypothetical protein RMSM_04635 [Rhodopirellula maiorica SM1]
MHKQKDGGKAKPARIFAATAELNPRKAELATDFLGIPAVILPQPHRVCRLRWNCVRIAPPKGELGMKLKCSRATKNGRPDQRIRPTL